MYTYSTFTICLLQYGYKREMLLVYPQYQQHTTNNTIPYQYPVSTSYTHSLTLVSTSVHSPSCKLVISLQLLLILELWLTILRLIERVVLLLDPLLLSGDECFSFSISVNFTEAPPLRVDIISPLNSSV